MLPPSCQICLEFASSVKSISRLVHSRKTDHLIRDFFLQENQTKNLKLLRMRGAWLMLEALRLMMLKSLRGSCPFDKTLHSFNSFCRKNCCSKFILLLYIQYFRSLHLKEKRHHTDKRKF